MQAESRQPQRTLAGAGRRRRHLSESRSSLVFKLLSLHHTLFNTVANSTTPQPRHPFHNLQSANARSFPVPQPYSAHNSRQSANRKPIPRTVSGIFLVLPTSFSQHPDPDFHLAANMVARGGRANKKASHAGAGARRERTKADRDGDLSMDGPVKGRGGRVGKSSGSGNSRKDLTAGKPKGGILSAASQRAILQHAGAGDVQMKGSRASAPSRGLTELKITNWTKNKASSSDDGGLSSLKSWLEKKASNRLSSRARTVKIKKVRHNIRLAASLVDILLPVE